MADWGRGLVLFSALLSPLAMADWQLDINFEMLRNNAMTSANSSVSLIPGEDTVIFDSNNDGAELIGRAELLEFDAEKIKVAIRVEEHNPNGVIRTLISPVVMAGLNQPASFEVEDSEQFMKLSVEVISA